MATWHNWARTESAAPRRFETPGSTDDLARVVVRASELGEHVKAVGAGHSYSAIACTDGHLVDLSGHRHVLAADPANPIPLTTPSAQQSGLKLNAKPFDVAEGQTVELVLDFDAARSVVRAGNSGKYLLKPVITVIAVLDAGHIACKNGIAPLFSTVTPSRPFASR